MILALDVGNTHILIGCMDEKNIYSVGRFKTDDSKTETEYAIMMSNFLQIYKIAPADVEGAVISSVVPPLTSHLTDAIRLLTGKEAIVVDKDIDTGLKIDGANRQQLGQDLITGAVAALAEYKPPLLIFDMGTATTISAIDKNGVYIGCSIIPGVMISQEALAARTSQLPKISMEAPPQVIGRNTPDCMKSGMIYGSAAMMDGMIERMEEELGAKATVLATGGLAKFMVQYCRREIICDENLMLKGLYLIYTMQTEKNNRA